MDVLFWVHLVGVVMKTIATAINERDKEADTAAEE